MPHKIETAPPEPVPPDAARAVSCAALAELAIVCGHLVPKLKPEDREALKGVLAGLGILDL